MTPPKELLKKLYTIYKEKTLQDYAKEPAVMELAQNEELIARLEPLHLPEITKLICANPALLERFKEKYEVIYPLYENPSVETMQSLFFEKENDDVFFVEKIFPLADEKILESFIQMSNRLNHKIKRLKNELDKQQNQKSVLEEDIQGKTRELSANIDNEGENETKISSIKGEITKKKNQLRKVAENISKQEDGLKKLNNQLNQLTPIWNEAIAIKQNYQIQFSKASEQAYCILNGKDEIIQQIEKFLKGQTTSPDFSKKLKDFTFSEKFIAVLFESYRDQAVSVMAGLYQDGDIDILDEPFSSALAENEGLVSAFFLKTYLIEEHGVFDAEKNDFGSWLNFIAEKSIQDGRMVRFGTFWKNIPSEECWCTVMRALFRNNERALDIVIKIMLGISGAPRGLLRSALPIMLEEGIIESNTSIIVALAENHTQGDDALLILKYFAQNLEKENERLKDKKEQLEYQASRGPSRIYGELSKPIENLEKLASDIATRTSEILPELVATKFKRYLWDLRKGLEELGIDPLEDHESWMEQNQIEYKAGRHSISISTPPKMVYLRTLGFVYHDAEGIKKTAPAIVGRLQEINAAKEKQKSVKEKETPQGKHRDSHKKTTTTKKKMKSSNASNAKKGSHEP